MSEELEKQKFEAWFAEVQRPAMIKFKIPLLEQELVRDIARMAWITRSQEEV